MKIAIGTDHAGFELKKSLVELLSKEYNVIDFGTFSNESCDYPDYAIKVAKAVQNKEADYGILLCTTGVGTCITANKFKGIRAGLCYSDETARLISEHNFANIICLPTKYKIGSEEITIEKLYNWVKVWLTTANSTEERHIRRNKKISFIEEQNFK